jgi:hypothetical protein
LAALGQRTSAAKTELRGTAVQRKAEIRSQFDADLAAVRDSTASKVAATSAELTSRRAALASFVDAERAAALATAEAEGTRAVGELEAAASDCDAAGEAEAARYPGSEDPAPEQRAAARKVAGESAADIRAKKPDVPRQLRTQAIEHGQRCADYAGSVLGQIEDARTQLAGKLRSTAAEAESAIRAGLDGALSAVDRRLAIDLAAIDAVTAATRQQLAASVATTRSDLDTTESTARAEMKTAAAGIDREIELSVEETATVVEETDRPFLPGVTEQITAARTGIATTSITGRQLLAAGAGRANAAFAAAEGAFDVSANTSIARAGDQLARIRSGFDAAATRARTSRVEGGKSVLAGLGRQQQTIADGVLAEVDRACGDARAELGRMSGEFRGAMRTAADRAVEEGVRPKTDNVNTRAREAADQVDDGWLAGLGRAIVKIAVGLVVLVVVALIVAAVAAAFGVILTAWTAVMIAGALLLAASLIFALIHRLGQAELSGRPGTAILLALSDTVGITGIYEAFKGEDIVTGTTLGEADRTERGVLGAVTLVSLILGARSAIKGPPGGVFTRPVGSVAGWSGLGAAGRALAGARSDAGEIASAIAYGVKSL